MPIEVRTVVDLPTYQQFMLFHLGGKKRTNRRVSLFVWIGLLATAVLAICTINPQTRFVGLPALIVVALCTALVIFFAYYCPKISYKKSLASLTRNTYVFRSDGFDATALGANGEHTTTHPFSSLRAAYEKELVFYLYLDHSQAFIVPKKDFVSGKPGQLRALLQQTMQDRFHCYCA